MRDCAVTDEPSPPLAFVGYRDLARTVLPAEVFDYIDGAAGEELTARRNRSDFDDLELAPLVMRDVSELDTTMALLGRRFPLPFGFAPTAFHRLVHPDGEVATARAARSLGIPMVVSAMASVPLEDVAAKSQHEDLWLQTYLFRDRGVTRELIQRAEDAGYRAVVVSVGCPVPGRRPRNVRNRFVLPDGVRAANFERGGRVDFNNPIHSIAKADLDPSATWDDIAEVRRTTSLPIVVKGVLNPRDVGPVLDLDLAGVVVSNHGGRQLDGTISTIRALPDVVAAVDGRVPILVDSGFRSGTDVLKALARGATGVLFGRSVLWSLAVAGERGVLGAMRLLEDELRNAMYLSGCGSTRELGREAAALLRPR